MATSTAYRPAYRATIYAPRTVDVNEATVLTPAAGAAHADNFQVASITGLSGWQPYLDPDSMKGRRGRLDLLKKKVDVGNLRLTLLDARVDAAVSNLARWVTAFLGDANGNPNWAGLKTKVEESLDGGATWADFFVGRTVAVRLLGRVRVEIDLEDNAGKMARMRMLTVPPHPKASPVTAYLWPLTIDAKYGLISAGAKITGIISDRRTVTVNGKSVAEATVTISPADRLRDDNAVLQELLDRTDPLSVSGSTEEGNIDTDASDFGSFALCHLTNATGYSGLFKIGHIAGFENDAAKAIGVGKFTVREREPAAGVATGTPQVQGAHTATDTTIVVDGWTASVTGIVKAGDVIRFMDHATNYLITQDANSDGSGVATITIRGGLEQNVADNTDVVVGGNYDWLALPADAATVQVAVVNNGPLNDAAPVLVMDRHPVQVWQDILDGYYGRRWQYGERMPPNTMPGDPKETIPYDASAFAALIASDAYPPLRLRETKADTVSDWVEEQICQPLQLGYYFNGSGELVPVDLAMPTSLAGIATVTSADLADVPDAIAWSHDAKAAITRYILKYYEDFKEMTGGALVNNLSKLVRDGSVVQRYSVAASAADHRVELLELAAAAQADNAITVDARGCRIMRTTDGGVLGDVLNAWLTWQRPRAFAMRLINLTRPYAMGPQVVKLQLTRASAIASAATSLPGKALLLDVDELPDAATHLRGGIRLIRVTERTESGLLVTLSGVDLGVNVVAATPTLAQPTTQTGQTEHGAQTVVTLNASDHPVEVHAAVTETTVGTAPAETDPDWFYVGMATIDGQAVVASPVPAGKRIWFRGRSLPLEGADLHLPSAWVAASGTGYATTSALTAPTGIAAGSLTATSALITWTINDVGRKHALYLVTPTGDPLEHIMTLNPGVDRVLLKYLTASTQYKVEVRATDGLGGESAGSNTTFTTTSTQTVAPDAGGIVILLADGVTL